MYSQFFATAYLAGPGRGSGPVINVTWYDATAYANWLSERGGQEARETTYAGSNDIGEVAWYCDNAGGETHPVGWKRAHQLGLYDMSGNVNEWCWDWYSSDYCGSAPPTNPSEPASGSSRGLRGGSWIFSASYARVASRYLNSPRLRLNFYGFRIVRPCLP